MRRCDHRQDDDEAKAAMNIIGMFECVGKIGAAIMLALISFGIKKQHFKKRLWAIAGLASLDTTRPVGGKPRRYTFLSRLTPAPLNQAIYRDPRQPMHRRLRPATECAPYIHPKLSAAAVLIGDDFASKLERAVKRSEKVLELEATKIEEER
jgi:hypothetical protein